MLYPTVAVTVLVVATVAICVSVAWLWHDEIVRAGTKRRVPGAGARPGPVRAARPESLEGVLTQQLLAGEITRHQYVRAIEGLAARDESRHPLAVPPELGPSGV